MSGNLRAGPQQLSRFTPHHHRGLRKGDWKGYTKHSLGSVCREPTQKVCSKHVSSYKMDGRLRDASST